MKHLNKRLSATLVAVVCILMWQYATATGREIDITETGAVAGATVPNTAAIQRAIDEAAASGGGKVVVPAGRFLTGTLELKSNVELHLEKDAVLAGSTYPGDYRKQKHRLGLILADGQEHISITGPGTIDGQGRPLALRIDSLYYVGQLDESLYNRARKRPDEKARPYVIEFVRCREATVSGVTVRNGACWVQVYEQCEKLTIDGVRIESEAFWNNDGIDISDCKEVRVVNCHVDSADDGICLKSHTAGKRNEDILIENCTVRSSASAVKFGTASRGGFKNVTIRNIKVYDTFRSAIAIESVDGGHLENILVDGIEAVNTGNAIFVRLGHRNTDGPVGSLRNVTIRNVKVQVPFERPDSKYELRGPALSVLHNPIPASITGLPRYKVEQITLENIEIVYPGRGNKGMAFIPLYRLDDVEERPAAYPEFSMFGELPAWGFYVRHVKGLTMKNVSVTAEKPDYRPAFIFDDVQRLRLSGMQVSGGSDEPQIILKEVTDSSIEADMRTVMTVSGKEQ